MLFIKEKEMLRIIDDKKIKQMLIITIYYQNNLIEFKTKSTTPAKDEYYI